MKRLFIVIPLLFIQMLIATFNLNATPLSAATQNKLQSPQNAPPNPHSSLQLSAVMNQETMNETGVSTLSPTQQEALASWIENWAASQQNDSQTKVAPNAIVAVLGDGHYVKLGDGSVWNVSPNAWIYTYYWKPGDIVNVSKSQDTLFPYSLSNQNYNQPATAQKASSQVSQSFTNGYTITEIRNGGQFIRLSNNTLWQVAPSARYQAAGWSNGQQVFVIQNTVATGGGYELLNGTTSRSVYANVVKNAAAIQNGAANNSSKSNNSPQKQAATNASQSPSQANQS